MSVVEVRLKQVVHLAVSCGPRNKQLNSISWSTPLPSLEK